LEGTFKDDSIELIVYPDDYSIYDLYVRDHFIAITRPDVIIEMVEVIGVMFFTDYENVNTFSAVIIHTLI
jgi:hypothetical protein